MIPQRVRRRRICNGGGGRGEAAAAAAAAAAYVGGNSEGDGVARGLLGERAWVGGIPPSAGSPPSPSPLLRVPLDDLKRRCDYPGPIDIRSSQPRL
jgi:hypothetical protein